MKHFTIILITAVFASGCLPEEEKTLNINDIVASSPAASATAQAVKDAAPVEPAKTEESVKNFAQHESIQAKPESTKSEQPKPVTGAASQPLSLSDRAALAREKARARREAEKAAKKN
ncbi:MAG: hypothetical protein N2235_05130 [Fischerella sp.]|nr:hypothetical protein [Fischerella sp.]